jgi:hypothetical protein
MQYCNVSPSLLPSIYSIQCRVQVDSSRVCVVCVETLTGRGERKKKASAMNQAVRLLHNDVGSDPSGLNLSFAMSTVSYPWPTRHLARGQPIVTPRRNLVRRPIAFRRNRH